ncbi:MAG: twin-arginine translocation signal domain-containing protein, partial [Acidobacteria bacterium]|nr:twin-arginine translocation signal domain-containing protein [Acidobacteriota bacterium]
MPDGILLSRRDLLKGAALAAVASAGRAVVVNGRASPVPEIAGDARQGQALERWEHYRGTLGGPWELWRGDAASDNVPWQAVQVPHCVNARDAVDPDTPYYQGPAWYRTTVTPPPLAPGGRLLLHFDGCG